MPSSRRRGVPTIYAGQQFRSLLEARWASFFDALGWPWEYEPFELEWYIPDFVLKFPSPILVEVKPETRAEDLRRHAGRIDAAGWSGEALLVGATIFESQSWYPHVGLLRDNAGTWALANLHYCAKCGSISLHHDENSYHCRVQRNLHEYAGNEDVAVPKSVLKTWREATNEVQWRRP